MDILNRLRKLRDKVGGEKTAKLLGVSHTQLRQWLYREKIPFKYLEKVYRVTDKLLTEFEKKL